MDRLLIMRNMKSLILFILLLVTLSCSETVDKQNTERINNASSVSELIEIAYELKNDSVLFYKICSIINDSIRIQSNIFALRTITKVDYENKEVIWSFENCGDDIPHFIDKLTFEIFVKTKDSIFIQSKLNNIGNIKELLEKFASRPDSVCKCYKKRIIDFFGEVELPKGGILLSIKVKKKKGLTKDEWKVFFSCLNETMFFFENKRNEIANEKWNCNYNSLNIKKKIAVSEISNLVMFIIFYID